MPTNPGVVGLEGYWSQDTDGTDAQGSNNLTENNAPAHSAGKVGNAVDFEESSSQSQSIADNPSVSSGDIDLTFCLWSRVESAHDGAILSKYDNATNNREYAIQYAPGINRFVFGLSADGTALTISESADVLGAPSLATWYFLTCQHDSVNNLIKISANAGTFDSQSYSSGIFDSSANFVIGGSQGGYGFFDGMVDEVAFYKRILTQDEIDWLYNAGAGRSYLELLGFQDSPQINFFML